MGTLRSPVPRLQQRLPFLLTLWLLIAVLALGGFTYLAGEVFAGDATIFDENLRAALHRHASPQLTAMFKFITFCGSPLVQGLVTLGASGLFWRAGWHRRAVLLLLAMGGGTILMAVLKQSFHRTRPPAYFDYPEPLSYSFPSGHALLSLCLYGLLAVFLGAHLRLLWRVLLLIAAALFVLAIGLSRIYLGVHYPTDVIAGYLAAFVWISGIGLLYQRLSTVSREWV